MLSSSGIRHMMHALFLATILSLIHASLYFLQLPTFRNYFSLRLVNSLPDIFQQAHASSEWDQLIDLSRLHPISDDNETISRAGTIFMKSKISSVVPVRFTTSGTCPVMTADFASLVYDVGQSIIRSHRGNSDRWPPIEQFQESIIIFIEDLEFRVSLDVFVERKIGNTEFAELVGLLVETVKRLSEATGTISFEAAKLTGIHKAVAFQAWWTWYSFINGVAGPCEGIAGVSREEL